MTSVVPSHRTANFDPDHYRMTVGEHLEELRSRLIRGLFGFVIATAVCLALGKSVIIPIFVRPLILAQMRSDINPGTYYQEAADVFMVYMEISMISGAVIASPWFLYQLWQFVAAGLYPHERKYVTKYLPLSITLLIAGWITLYFLVLPISLQFFFEFGSSVPLYVPSDPIPIPSTATTQPAQVPMFHGNPPGALREGMMWIDADTRRLMIFFHDEPRALTFGPSNLASPLIALPRYIDMVVNMLIAFGISFQLPLVVMALVRMGILEIDFLKSMRKYVYFVIAIIAAVIIPDVVTGWFMLMIPLFLLYELGIFLASRKPRESTDAS